MEAAESCVDLPDVTIECSFSLDLKIFLQAISFETNANLVPYYSIHIVNMGILNFLHLIHF